MPSELNMINWTINSLIQQRKSEQRHNAALNMTLYQQSAKQRCQSHGHCFHKQYHGHIHMQVFIIQSLVFIIEIYMA